MFASVLTPDTFRELPDVLQALGKPRSPRSVLNYLCGCDTGDPEIRDSLMMNAHRMARDGRGDQILLADEDVTERELARKELERQKVYVEKIVDSSHDALLVLDLDLRVRTANETFYRIFQVDPSETLGRLVYNLGNGQWNISVLRSLLQNVLPENNAFDDFDIEHAS